MACLALLMGLLIASGPEAGSSSEPTGTTEPAAKVDTPEKPADPKQPPSPPPAELGSGLKQTGPNSWELTRSEVFRVMAALPFVAHQLWVREVYKDKKLVGYKLKHIKKGSLPHKAGFRNGDVVATVAGKRLLKPETLLLELPGKEVVEVRLWRAGKLRTQTYRFIPD
jgi:hypothetical protein